MNPKPYSPMSIQARIDSYADMVRVIARRIAQEKKDQDWAMDQLMQAEAEVLGKAHGWEDATLSGVVPAGKNRYAPPPPPEPPPAPPPLPEDPPEEHAHHKRGHKHEHQHEDT
jgi:hypothetical protein